MIDQNLRFHGYAAEQWIRLVSLWTASETFASAAATGTAVVVLDDDDEMIAGLHTQHGPITLPDGVDVTSPRQVCEHVGAERAFVLREGVLETLAERGAMQVSMRDGYVGQWLGLLTVARGLAQEGKLRVWPGSIAGWRLPSAYGVQRGLDALLPDNTSLTLVLWREEKIWTALTLRKRAGSIDHIVGPEAIASWAGPLGGDYRRDYRAIARGISKNLAPLHLGIFAEESVFRRLLSDATPGAWASAVAVRDVIVYPSPGYVAFAVGADAVRAVAQRSALAVARAGMGGWLTPVTEVARRALAAAPDMTSHLGVSSLQSAGSWLRTWWTNRDVR